MVINVRCYIIVGADWVITVIRLAFLATRSSLGRAWSSCRISTLQHRMCYTATGVMILADIRANSGDRPWNLNSIRVLCRWDSICPSSVHIVPKTQVWTRNLGHSDKTLSSVWLMLSMVVMHSYLIYIQWRVRPTKKDFRSAVHYIMIIRRFGSLMSSKKSICLAIICW